MTMADLFEGGDEAKLAEDFPLARRMTPRDVSEFVGQERLLGDGKILRRAIESDRIRSLILYGPPGSGKTALARIVARRTKSAFETLNAVTSGVKELRELISAAKQRKRMSGKRTIVFIDEIHRFNRTQQDALLPDVESGSIILIGATTQNPFFSVVAPLLSRSQIFELDPLSEDEIGTILRRAIEDKERGFPDKEVELTDDAFKHLARYASGDARVALNGLEIAVLTTAPNEDGTVVVTREAAEESIQKKAVVYDGTGDDHYDTISAFIKSMRGSDPDSALYWLAKMLEAGEDPRFIARRIAIAAAEDVGNADPQALVVANAAWQVCEFIGMPEAQIPLAQATVYVATAPKSNASYIALGKARKEVREEGTVPVPRHLKGASFPGAERLGRGEGYLYPHDHEGAVIEQFYGVEDGRYYSPTNRGYETEIARRLDQIRKKIKEDQPEQG